MDEILQLMIRYSFVYMLYRDSFNKTASQNMQPLSSGQHQSPAQVIEDTAARRLGSMSARGTETATAGERSSTESLYIILKGIFVSSNEIGSFCFLFPLLYTSLPFPAV